MKKAKILALILAVVMISSLFAACGPKDTASGTLTFSISGDIDNFDPYTNQTLTFIKTIGYNCYESLLHIGEDMEYVFDIAESVEQPDDFTYIFKLRSGVKFHDGTTMTAEDVKFSFERTQDAALASWLGAFFTCVDTIEAVDANTVKFNLGSFSNTFLDDVAMVKIVKQGTENDLKQKPIGTGPFKFVSWSPNDNITLERFADYWDASKVKIEKLVLKPIPDKNIQLTNLSSGTVNFVEDLPLSDVDTINADANLQLIQTKSSNSTILFEVGRHNFEPFSDPTVMKVMAMALDKETINTTVFKDLAKVIWSPYPSGVKFFKDIAGPGYDTDAAKALLATTEWPDGFEFDCYLISGFPEWEKLAVIYADALSKIGITMNIKIEDISVWLDQYLNRTYQMIINQYPMAGTDPNVYNTIILSQLYPYQLSDLPQVETLISQAATETDQDARKAMYEQIQDLVYEYKPVMSIVEAPLLYGASKNLKGIKINPVGHTFFKEAYFE